jgi:hypothetical protein
VKNDNIPLLLTWVSSPELMRAARLLQRDDQVKMVINLVEMMDSEDLKTVYEAVKKNLVDAWCRDDQDEES